ncbi:hypothetical protein [Roseovarius pacificus]|uniref:hypothetical protein n=1 Tax=Roseovarius pacificus TaxID=337701 RepID=UPI004039E057
MSKKVAIIDTSLMCCWLKVPGKATAGSAPDLWDYDRTCAEIQAAEDEGRELVFPLTCLIETGNFIACAGQQRREKALQLCLKLRQSLSGERPWSPFTDQFANMDEAALRNVVEHWPDAAARGVSIGDFLITEVADYYSRSGLDVTILTSDALLRSHVPAKPAKLPRRRRGGA